ncbi:glycerol kinase GlpK [Rubellimicrobium aerolatum]|uniref:Glycerol kinase n=1 Tax=Rubellimicrobium aerolatum TaxID=490979 RepID=A0ABW0S837_9RHOB|nr:glycerol kinase GlpK [Rubellimicrobium aerolatum]MBP1804371.1 glycerol kinase [Rubellimicrobium aerolatum]
MTRILAIDQGTTSSRALLFDGGLRPIAVAQEEFPQLFPHPGWVEHDPEAIWSTTLSTARRALDGVRPGDVAALGITNQRETTLVWDRATGRPIHNAIVWQDRRTGPLCEDLAAEGWAETVAEATGLLLDPYFSATKLAWLLDTVEGARDAARAGRLLFGTVDSFLIWRLTEGRCHLTDATNAARTMLYDIRRGVWREDLCERLGIPLAMLPEVRDCAGDFGVTTLLGGTIPIRGVAGDQQAATIGQACFEPGMMKSTYGTGCFALLNTGPDFVRSTNRLLTTIAYRLDGRTTFALEGSIFVAGAVVQWLRDGLRLIDRAETSQTLAEAADPEQDVVLVPAFTGLGAPYWDAEARGAIFGLTRATGPAELARAALESVAFQTHDLWAAMRRDWPGAARTVLRVDGGMTASDWTMQRLADLLGAPVDRPVVRETTALGAAWLAGHAAGVVPGPEGFARDWSLDRRFEPTMDEAQRRHRLALWDDAVRRVLSR